MYGIDEELVKDVDNFDYFVFADSSVIDLNNFARDLWPFMRNEFNEELKQFASKMQMNLTSTLARLLLINHYNYLKMKNASISPSETRVSSGN
jgi:hypothetical protein